MTPFSRLVVGFLAENRTSRVPAVEGMVDPAGFVSTFWPRHSKSLTKASKLEKSPDPFSSSKGLPRRRITLEADPEGGIDDIYDMIDDYLNEHHLPTTILNVTQVGLKFEFDSEREDLPRSLSFELSWPNSSNLKSKPEAARELAAKYLRQWGLDRVATAQNAQPAA